MPSSYISKIGARSKVLKIFVGAQYVLTFLLLVAVIIVNSQLNFFMNNRLGNEQEKLININKIPCQVANKFHLFKEELLKNPLIKDVTCSMETPGEEIMDMVGFKTSGISEENAKKLIYLSPVDDNFFSFYRIKLVAGKSFPKFNGVDSSANSYILNEKAVKYLGWKNEEAIGKPFKLNIEYFAKELGHIVGVVSDFQPSSMKNEIKPYIYLQKSVWLFEAQVKYDTKQQEKCLSVIKDTWKRIYPDFPFEFEYVEDLYSKVYTNEIQLKNLSFILSVLASLLSAIGLLGITGLVYEAKTKEIGIRKVNGAKIVEILNWLIADIIVVVVVAIFIAVPLAYYFVSKWLDNYVYKTDLSPWIFIAGGLILIGIALLTVIWQTWKAATRNPVEALRYE
jgi:putative ABC transport system permease protein